MKKLLLIIALSLSLGSATGFGYDDRSGSASYGYTSRYRDDRLGWEINHINRMLDHVRRELRISWGGWRLRGEVDRLSGEVDRVNWKFNHGAYDRHRLHRQVERIHAELHNLEVRLNMRPSDYYRWD
jgi:hypothetical protein